MSQSNRTGQNWLKMTIAMGVLAIGLLISRLSGAFTTAEAINIFLVGALVLVTAVYAKETANISKSSEEAARSAAEQAEASKKLAEEAREQRLMASRPIIIQRSVYKQIREAPDSDDLSPTLRSSHFSHFVVMNVGNGPAMELEVSLMDKEKKKLHSVRVTFLRAGEKRDFIESHRELVERKESTYYLVCEYKHVFAPTTGQTWHQTWLPFQLRKSSVKGEMHVVAGELEFHEVSEKDRIDAFTSRSKPK